MRILSLVLISGSLFSASQALADDLTVFQQSLKPCTDVDQAAGRCDKSDAKVYTACLTYRNDSLNMMKCDLRGNAMFVERYTGNTKEVTDFRTEKLFPQQQHRVCFNFKKDEYNLWNLKKIGVPNHSCVVDGTGGDPSQQCDVRQENCDRPAIDTDTECSPYDWSCS